MAFSILRKLLLFYSMVVVVSLWPWTAWAAINLRMSGQIGLDSIGTISQYGEEQSTTVGIRERLGVQFRGNVMYAQIGSFGLGFSIVNNQQDINFLSSGISRSQNSRAIGYNFNLSLFPRTFFPFTFSFNKNTNDSWFDNVQVSDLSGSMLVTQELNLRRWPQLSLMYNRLEYSPFSSVTPNTITTSSMLTAKQETYDYNYLATYLRTDSGGAGFNGLNLNISSEYFDPVLVWFNASHADSTTNFFRNSLGMRAYYSESPDFSANVSYNYVDMTNLNEASMQNNLTLGLSKIVSPQWRNSLGMNYSYSVLGSQGVPTNFTAVSYSTTYTPFSWISLSGGLGYSYFSRGVNETVSSNYSFGASHGGTLFGIFRYGLGYTFSRTTSQDIITNQVSDYDTQDFYISLSSVYNPRFKQRFYNTDFYANFRNRYEVDNKGGGTRGIYSALDAGFNNNYFANLYLNGQVSYILSDPKAPDQIGLESVALSARYVLNRNINLSLSRSMVYRQNSIQEGTTDFSIDANYAYRLQRNLFASLSAKVGKLDYDINSAASRTFYLLRTMLTYTLGRTVIIGTYQFNQENLFSGTTNVHTIMFSVTRFF